MNFTSGLTFVGNARDPDVVYYNATIINNNTAAGNQDDPIVSFKETKDLPILSDTSQYEMCVTKVSMEGAQKTLPIFIPQIEIVTNTDASGVSYTTMPDVNKSVYSVSFGVVLDISGGQKRVFQNTQNVMWMTENVNSAVPSPQTLVPTPVGNNVNPPFARQFVSDYYYAYTYNHWLICVNNAISAAWSNVRSQVYSAYHSYPVTRLPYMEYDEVTKLFSFYTDTATSVTPASVDLSGGSIHAQEYSYVGYNTNFEGIFTNFDTQYYGSGLSFTTTLSTPQPSPALPTPLVPGPTSDTEYPENIVTIRNKSGTNIQLALDPTTGLGYASPPASLRVPYISFVTTQDFCPTGSLWSPISEIVLTTQNIPVRNEYVSAPIRPGVGNMGTLAPSASQFQTLLTDFTLEQGKVSDDWRGYLRYEPNLHKMVMMSPSKDELKTLDVNMYWRYRLTNELIPVRIYNLGSISLQLMFRRKGQDA